MPHKESTEQITLATIQGWNVEVAIQCLGDATREVSIVRDRIRKEQREEWRPLLERWLFGAERQAELAYYEYLLATALQEDMIEYDKSNEHVKAA